MPYTHLRFYRMGGLVKDIYDLAVKHSWGEAARELETLKKFTTSNREFIPNYDHLMDILERAEGALRMKRIPVLEDLLGEFDVELKDALRRR